MDEKSRLQWTERAEWKSPKEVQILKQPSLLTTCILAHNTLPQLCPNRSYFMLFPEISKTRICAIKQFMEVTAPGKDVQISLLVSSPGSVTDGACNLVKVT